MHSNRILDSVTNLLVRHMVFIGNVQTSPIAALTDIKKVDKMTVRISLTLEASEMFLSFHMIFSLERAAVVWSILERISGFDPSLSALTCRFSSFDSWQISCGLLGDLP